jgi:hypothetical protein
VSEDIDHAYAQNKQMLTIALKSRVVVAGMNVLRLSEIDGKPPTGLTYPPPIPQEMIQKKSEDIYGKLHLQLLMKLSWIKL